jgi:cell division protein FtsI/penicillin-binding protein 2
VPRRFPHLIALLTLGFAGVVARLAFVQLWCHSEFSRRVLQQSSRWLNEAPRRLPIVDRNGAVLAESVRVASCYADPRAMRRPEATVQRLAALLLDITTRGGIDQVSLRQSDLADLMAVRRASISVASTELCAAGAIRLRRAAIQILNSDALRRLAGEPHSTVTDLARLRG